MDLGHRCHRSHGSIHFLTTITSTVNLVVNLLNGRKEVVTHIGKLTSTLALYTVLCVPTFSFNLISVSQLTKSIFCCLIFLNTLCYLQALQPWQTIGLGRAKGNLYLLDTALFEFPSFSYQSFVSNVSCTNNSAVLPASLNSFTSAHDKDQDVHLWHARLGHPSISRQMLLSKCIPHVAIDNKKTVYLMFVL